MSVISIIENQIIAETPHLLYYVYHMQMLLKTFRDIGQKISVQGYTK